MMTDYENAEDMKKLIAGECGIARIVPKPRKLEEATGHVTFAGDAQSTASITFFVAGSHYDLVSRECGALERFCGIMSYLKKRELCCTSFTMLHYTSQHEFSAIELSQVSFKLAFNLLAQMKLLLNNWENPRIIPKCLPEFIISADLIVRNGNGQENI